MRSCLTTFPSCGSCSWFNFTCFATQAYSPTGRAPTFEWRAETETCRHASCSRSHEWRRSSG
ncbi:unnamed protein product [Ixodes persulcatus]